MKKSAGDNYGVEFDSSSEEEPVAQERTSPRIGTGPMSHLERVSRMMEQANSTSLFSVPSDTFSQFHVEPPAYLTQPMKFSPDKSGRVSVSPTSKPAPMGVPSSSVSSLLIQPGNVDMSGVSGSFYFSHKKDEFVIPVELPMMAPEIPVETTILQEPKYVFDTMEVPLPGSSRIDSRFPLSSHRTLTAVIEEDEEGNVSTEVQDIRKKCKVNEIHVKELLEKLSEVSKIGPDGLSMFIDRDSFKECFESLYETNRIIPPQEDGVLDSLFDSLNHSVSKDRISTNELISGLVLSAGGTRDEKMATIFCLVDASDEGALAINELVMFFTLIFQNVFNKRVVGAMLYNGINARDPDSLALRTATECMDMCELNEKGRIRYDELTRWIEKPRHSPVLGTSAIRRK